MKQSTKRAGATAVIVLLLLAMLPVTASAASVVVSNYYYAHANTPGVFTFKDKTGGTVQFGDGIEFDAEITGVDIEAEGMGPGDYITAYSSGGASWPITANGMTSLSIPAHQSMTLKLTKASNNEVYARMATMNTFDQDDGGTNVSYLYSLNDMPTEYGDLGSGTGTVADVPGNHYYFEPRDAYKYDYTAPTGATRYELHFLDGSGNTMYKRDYEQPPSGTHYLTCNGTYEMRFYNGSGQMIAKSQHMQTTEIVSPSCSSFPGNGGGFDDFPVDKTPNNSGGAKLDWDDVPGAVSYDIYKDGELIGTTTDSEYDVPDDSSPYTVIAKDGAGEIVGQTDVPGSSGGCDVCQQIRDALNCPEWDTYMGELTQAIQAALPDPPDWPSIAQTFVNAFDGYFGDPPAVPSKEDIAGNITPPLPSLNTSAPDAAGTPTVPSEFNNPMEFDITDGPEIPVVDESEPITIYEPDQYIDADEPGEIVLPGDPDNTSNGIKEPETVETDYPAPVPGGEGSELPPDPEIPELPEVPPANVPVPGGSSGTLPTDPEIPELPEVPPAEIPIPGGGSSDPPTPTGGDGSMPIPTKGGTG